MTCCIVGNQILRETKLKREQYNAHDKNMLRLNEKEIVYDREMRGKLSIFP